MAITRPVVFTPIEDIEVTRNHTVSEELVRKMIQNSNLLGALAVIGSIRCMAINQPGVSSPSTDVWQLATGSQITQPQSPITSVGPFDRFTPDFTNVYIRGAMDDTANNIGGAYTVDLSHTHTIGARNGTAIGEEGDEQQAYAPGHSHGVNNGLPDNEPLEPAHQEVATYLKIN